MKFPHNTPVTLEDLLRLKRAERPSPQFWAQFERDLREKQLAAIIVRRPWWAPMLRGWVRFAHLQLPVGATAILALTFLTVREYHVARVEDGIAPVVAKNSSTTFAVNTPDQALVRPAMKNMESARVATVASRPAEADQPEVMPSLGDVAQVVPLLDAPSTMAESPSARSIAANLAAAQVIDPELAETLTGQVDIEMRGASVQRMDPLARISKPSDARRARLLAGSLPASPMYASTSLSTEESSHERLTSRLEDRLYDTIHRFDVDGRSVSIKF